MVVKIVTDSSADLPANIAKELDITVVPLYVRFGEQVYRDRVDITEDEFYKRLTEDTVHPNTIQPSPQDFTNVYKDLGKDADGIVSIHISSKLSGTSNSALQAKEYCKGVQIEVIDSQLLSAALALITISAAKMAKEGAKLVDVVKHVNKAIQNTYLEGLLDTLKYLMLGGRIGKAKALVGSLLNIKPVLILKDGEVMPAGQVRSRSKGIERLFEFAKNAKNPKGISIAYNTTPVEAQALAERIAAAKIFDLDKILMVRIGPMLGVHMGPGTIIVAYQE
ncbi:MAG: DegV family protein [Dehalococcoidales bacterium]|nr:DegV family protein [Dehalococcoidales bacterium]